MIDANNIIDVKINSNFILSLTECIICSEQFNKTTTTKCGHTFCEVCILNCINIHNCCPTCKTPLKKEELIKNFITDEIITYVKSERSKEEYKKIENSYKDNEVMSSGMNRIQVLFFENMKHIFNSFSSFYEEAEKENKRKLRDLLKIQEEMLNIGHLFRLEASHENLIQSLEESLDEYMKNIPQSPLLLPVKVKVFIERKSIYIDHIQLYPNDNTDKLYDIVNNYISNLGDEIININDAAFYVMNTEFDLNINSQLDVRQDERKIEKGVKVITQRLPHGVTLMFKGDYLLKSDEPQHCLTYNFEKIKGSFVKYFSCESCKLNWICEECGLNCHKDHGIKLYRANHEVTWACCYCFKGNCLLKNNKNKN